MGALGEGAWSGQAKGHIFVPPLNALAEENKSWHWFNGDVPVVRLDLISSRTKPSGRPTTASGYNSWHYRLTGGLPCTAARRERVRVWSEDVALLSCAGLTVSSLLFLECRRGLARATVQWNGKHVSPCSAWCRVTVRGCVMFLGYWLNDLGLHDRSLNPCRLSACWQRNVSSTCLHIDLRNLLDWHVHIPKVSPSAPTYTLFMT